jgi:2-iminobutanoate/2-iminopropanoate deaminase
MSRQVLESSQAPKAIGPYSQGVSVERGKMIFCSGQIPLHPQTGELVTGDIRKETEQVLSNLKAVLEAGVAVEGFSTRKKSTQRTTNSAISQPAITNQR